MLNSGQLFNAGTKSYENTLSKMNHQKYIVLMHNILNSLCNVVSTKHKVVGRSERFMIIYLASNLTLMSLMDLTIYDPDIFIQ